MKKCRVTLTYMIPIVVEVYPGQDPADVAARVLAHDDEIDYFDYDIAEVSDAG